MTPNSVNIKRPLIDGFTTIISRTSPRLRVLVFGGLLAIAGVALLLITPSATSSPERAWSLPFFGLVIAFGLAEATALHVEIRKESHSLSLSGIPMMFGLLRWTRHWDPRRLMDRIIDPIAESAGVSTAGLPTVGVRGVRLP